MDTIQKNRQEVTLPSSAQQKNGAVRSAEEQRAATAKRTARPAEAKEKTPAKKAPVQKKAAVKTAPQKKKQEAPVKKKEAPGKSQRLKADPEDVPNKKRAYGNSKPKQTPADKVNDIFQKSAQRKAERLAKQGKAPKAKRPQQPTPAVIYTQPATFNRNRLLVQLVTVVAVVMALVLCLSVFFKVEHITVSGEDVYTRDAIVKASGLESGQDNLLTFSRPRAAAMIKAKLPYVDTVRFGIKLPDTVNIIVREDEVAYAIKDQNGTWWMMSSEGRVVEMGDNAKASNNTQILGVTLMDPLPDQRGVAAEMVTTETMEGGEPVPVTTTGAQKLTAALQILQALEENGIVGEVASVDMSRLEDIILWYGSRYQVNLGDSTNLDYKIACMHDAILQMSEWQSGILDISFTIWPNQVGYTPFA